MIGVTGSGPACSTASCHQRGYPVLGNAPTLTNCASCHDKPPTGAAAPNRGGAHAKHNALAGVTNVCNTCHSGAGTGTTNHFNGTVDAQLLSAYNAKSGAAARNVVNGTCSKVSCHGGQTTPAWLTGTIDVNSQCTSSHAFGTAEYNSYSSGRHNTHPTSHRIPCTGCHDIVKLVQNHFTSLNTATMEGPAAGTLRDAFITSYDAATKACLATAGCHNTPGTRQWQ
jgi:predicted CxxxxCH...CXXCH cytochrome family protein